MLYVDLQSIEWGFLSVVVKQLKQFPAWSSLLSSSLPIIEPVMKEGDGVRASLTDRQTEKSFSVC